MTIKATFSLKGVEYKIENTLESKRLFKRLTGHSFLEFNNSISDIIILAYCMLKPNNPTTFNYSLDEFIDLCDEGAESIPEITNKIQSIIHKN